MLIDEIAEERIRQAMREGAFEDLPGAGAPLVLDDDTHIPEELRTAYRVLKNAGFIPPEVSLRREITHVSDLLDRALTEEERQHASRRLNYLLMQLSGTRGGADLRVEQAYFDKLIDRF